MSTSLGPPVTWNFVRSLICCALLTNLCCSTAALYTLCCHAVWLCFAAALCQNALRLCFADWCPLLLHSTTALYYYALLVRSTTALNYYTSLSRSTLILYYCASRYRIRPTSQWSSKRQLTATQRDRPIDWDTETLKFTSRVSRYQLHQLLGDFKIFYVLWVDSLCRPQIK